MQHRQRLVAVAIICLIGAASLPTSAAKTSPPIDGTLNARLAEKGCAVLAGRVDAVPGTGPVFLRSFDGADGKGPSDNPALATAAFTYDNALAIIALTACGHDAQALRVGTALLAAATHDRAGGQGRLRNAYRGGPQEEVPLPNGWWDKTRNEWLEDDYEVGTSTGNVAWAALALLTLADRTNDSRFMSAAAGLAEWALIHAADARGAGGFTGGLFGGDEKPRKLTWKATEHNVDLAAVFLWLARSGVSGEWLTGAHMARLFVDTQWDEATGHFITGTTLDGVTENYVTSGLDTQFWPLLLPEASRKWRRALAYAERAHGVTTGFSFNDDRSGMWTEGTAQAALAFCSAGQAEKADRYLGEVAKEFSSGGYLWATPEARVSTGLRIGPDSIEPDFFYYHLPHLGATAWAVIAATGWNPFMGHRLQGCRSIL
jgi:hypothetical protein